MLSAAACQQPARPSLPGSPRLHAAPADTSTHIARTLAPRRCSPAGCVGPHPPHRQRPHRCDGPPARHQVLPVRSSSAVCVWGGRGLIAEGLSWLVCTAQRPATAALASCLHFSQRHQAVPGGGGGGRRAAAQGGGGAVLRKRAAPAQLGVPGGAAALLLLLLAWVDRLLGAHRRALIPRRPRRLPTALAHPALCVLPSIRAGGQGEGSVRCARRGAGVPGAGHLRHAPRGRRHCSVLKGAFSCGGRVLGL